MEPTSPPDLRSAVREGSYEQSLVALRDYIAGQLDECDSKRDAAALTARLADVLERIENLPSRAEVSRADEVAERRAKRRAGAHRASRAAGSS